MKKRLFSLFAMATMLFMASCSEEDLVPNAGGEEGVVRFSIGLEGGLTTRALANQEKISDGKGADQLMYAVFNEKGDKVLINKVTENGVTFDPAHTVDLKLAKNQTYQVVFWAQNSECSAYTVSDDMNVSVNYNGVVNNDEKRDAFFKSHTVKVTGAAQTEDVVLKRPFAQLNVGVTDADWQNAMISGIEIESSKVTVNNVANSLNLLTGAVSGAETIEFGLSAIPASLRFNANDQREKQLVVKDDQGNDVAYKYLSMTYLLVNDGPSATGASKATLSELAFTFHPKSGNDIVFKEGLNNVVPVQRNWRTNIIGQILTGNVTFKITIDQDYDGEYNGLPFDQNGKGVKANGTYYATIKEAIDAGATVMELAAGTYKMPSVSNKNLSITGATKEAKIDLSDVVDLSETTVNFKNITIVKENENYVGFHHASTLNYTDCVFENEYWAYGVETFTDCVFNQTSSDSYNVWTYGATTATFKNCVFNSAGKAVLVYKENGSTWYNAIFNNCTFNASVPVEGKAAIEIDSSLNPYNVTISDCTANGFAKGSVSGNILYNLKKGTLGTNCNIFLNGVNTCAEGLTVDGDGKYYATTDAGIEAAMDLNEKDIKVVLNSDVTVNVTAWATLEFGGDQSETITIDGNGKTLTFNQTNSDWNNITTANDAKLIIKNAHLSNSGYNNGPWNRHDLNFACNVELINVTSDKAIALKAGGILTDVTINDANTSDTYALWIQPNGQTVTLNGCVIDMIACSDGRGIKIDEQYVDSPAKVTLNVSNTVFKTEEKSAILVKSKAGADIVLSNINIVNVEADKVNAVWVDENSSAYADLVTVTGGTKIVEP